MATTRSLRARRRRSDRHGRSRPNGGFVVDTNNNATDFIFVDTNGTSAGAGQRLGAPGPENLSSPTFNTAAIAQQALDTCVSATTAPNLVRDFTSDPANNSTFGTLDIRRTYTNNTGVSVTRLRFRVIDLTTFPAPPGFAYLRPRTSTAVVVTVDRPPCGSGTSNITVQGTALDQPPSQPNGGGFNSSMSAGTVTLGTPLANGASIDLRFLLGIQQNGTYKFAVITEALPEGGVGGGSSTFFAIEGVTVADTTPPVVNSITLADPNPTASGSTVHFTVTFSESVTGVDTSDFTLTTTGSIAGASVTSVAGGPSVYTVTVNTGTGVGTVRLDVTDNDTIMDASSNPLGGAGAGNGNFTSGQAYDVVAPGAIPLLDPRALALLAVMLAAIAIFVMRRV